METAVMIDGAFLRKKKTSLPVTNRAFLFDSQPQYQKGLDLLSGISQLDFFAVRLGQLQFSGWSLKKKVLYTAHPLHRRLFRSKPFSKGCRYKDWPRYGLDWIPKHSQTYRFGNR